MGTYIFLNLVISGTAVACFSSSPYFGIFGVLLQSLAFAGLLCYSGLPFFALIVALIYVGGMIIIFLFSAILSAERYPQSGAGLVLLLWLVINLMVTPFMLDFGWAPLNGVLGAYGAFLREGEVGDLYSTFSPFFILVGVALLIALVIVLVLGFEHGRKNLRKL